MKKSVLMIMAAGLLLSLSSSAQNVGIGISTPAQKLDVNGTARVRSLTTNGVVTNNSSGDLGTLAGTTTTVLHGNASGLPTFSSVALTSDVSGTLPVGNGGTGATSLATGAILIGNGTGAISNVAGVASGSVLTSAGVGVAPTWTSNNGLNWTLKGNSGITQPAAPTTYGTSTLGTSENWIGNTDAKDLTFGTNNLERMRLLSTGEFSIGSAAPVTGTGGYSLSSYPDVNHIGLAVLQNNTASTQNLLSLTQAGTGRTIDITHSGTAGRVISINQSSTSNGNNGFSLTYAGTATALVVSSSNTANTAIVGSSVGAAGAGNGTGVSGLSTQSAGFGVWGTNSNSTGTGVVGGGNNQSSSYLTSGSGGAFTGNRYGSYSQFPATTSVGSSYVGYYTGSINLSNASLRGASTSAYQFGTVGEKDQNYAGSYYYDYRSGGVLGVQYRTDNTTILSWGTLGYKSSASTDYGLYCGTGTGSAASSGGGYLPNVDLHHTGIGLGSYGGMMGGWLRGNLMGIMSSGDLFASYNNGNEYTTGYQADIVKVNGGRQAAFAVTSAQLKIYEDGKGNTVGGTAYVSFPETFKAMLSDEIPTVTISAIGDCKGLFIQSMDKNGFTVKELQGGNSSVSFTWIAVGKRLDSKDAVLPADLAKPDFDENMEQVMFDERVTDKSAKPIWYDGHEIKFTTAPKEVLDGFKISAEEGKKHDNEFRNSPKPNYTEASKK